MATDVENTDRVTSGKPHSKTTEAAEELNGHVQMGHHHSDSLVTVRFSDAEHLSTTTANRTTAVHPTPLLKIFTDDNSTARLSSESADFCISPTSTRRPPSSPLAEKSPTPGEETVDWDKLEKSEKKERISKDFSDENMAFLLARLERENTRLEKDPKLAKVMAIEKNRPPSIHDLTALMRNPDPRTLRYSQLPAPPPLTDMDFFVALVSDYRKTATLLPNVLTKKVRAGLPPPLRGVIWVSMAGARDADLVLMYDRYLNETSPYEQIIGKDLGRTFPGVEMFQDENGEGQRLLGRVLRAYSIHDSEIGYCQGYATATIQAPIVEIAHYWSSLGFLVGPLLMHMGERQAFCVLVRLMEAYELRSCFLPSLYGLQLRMYQFQSLLATHLPELSAHLESLNVQPVYVSQWFLSFFAATCPLPMLLRIYDVIFAEGAAETLMRVAISVMRINATNLMRMTEEEDVMQTLLGKRLWVAYGYQADVLVQDFCGLTGIVTKEALDKLEQKFRADHPEENARGTGRFQASDLQNAASRFLGRLWAGSSNTLSPSPNRGGSRPRSFLRRTASKQSVATVSSADGSENGTETATMSRTCSEDQQTSNLGRKKSASKDHDLHDQIEDLLTAMSELQRDYAAKMEELATVKLQWSEERELGKKLADMLSNGTQDDNDLTEIHDVVDKLQEMYADDDLSRSKSLANNLSKELVENKDKLSRQMSRTKVLEDRCSNFDAEISRLKTQVQESRRQCQQLEKEKMYTQKQLHDERQRKMPDHVDSGFFGSEPESATPSRAGSGTGLREFKLGRAQSANTARQTPQFSKRSSSLGIQPLVENNTPIDPNSASANTDALLVELAGAKTGEAVAKQELEELRARFNALRQVVSGNSTSPSPALERSNSLASYLNLGGSSGTSSPAASSPATTVASAFGRWNWAKKTTTMPITRESK